MTYRQQYAGLEVYAADLIVQINKTGGVDAVHSDIMRDASVFEGKQVSLEPTIDAATAKDRATAWTNADWKAKYRRDVDLKLSTSPPKLMIFAPSVVGKNGKPYLSGNWRCKAPLCQSSNASFWMHAPEGHKGSGFGFWGWCCRGGRSEVISCHASSIAVEYAGAVYHVHNRANYRQDLFTVADAGVCTRTC